MSGTSDAQSYEGVAAEGDVAGMDVATGDVATGVLLNAADVAEAWLAQLADKMAVPAGDVQDHLLDLWGVLDEGPAREEVERWLTETLRRNLYSVADINVRLEALLPTP